MSDAKNNKTPTISDVAKAAGVSTSTVSRALSGKVPVHPETLHRIQAAAKALNYQPSVLARGLKEGSSRTIGLIVPDITNPVFPAVALGAESEALKKGYQVFLAHSHEDDALEKQLVQMMLQRRVDGLLIASAARDKASASYANLPIPVVQLVRKTDVSVPSVICNQTQIGQLAGQHLLKRGYEHPVLISGDLKLGLYQERRDSFFAYLLQAGLSKEQLQLIDGSQSQADGLDLVEKILDSGADSVFASCDMQALGIVKGLLAAGRKIPGDIAVIGMDNLALCHLMTPAITCIRQPLQEVGRQALRHLLSWIEQASAPNQLILPCHLQIGETT